MIGLEDFVSETLTQIIRGVVAAREVAREHGACIAPTGLSGQGFDTRVTQYCSQTGDMACDITFDLAVTSTEASGKNAGVKAFIGVVTLGAQGKSDNSSQSVSRIQFSIPMLLPSDSSKARAERVIKTEFERQHLEPAPAS